jgi:transposase-like protein
VAQHFLLTRAARNFTLDDVELLDEEGCRMFLAGIRWGVDGKQVCPSCGVINKHYYVRVRGQWRCKDCGHTFSVTSGTKFADHKLSLKTLVRALLLYVTSVKGISASQLARTLGLAYQTAFTLLHKLREGLMAGRDTTPLKGHAQLDGGHFSGRTRKPRKKKKATAPPLRTKSPSTANPLHPNRRIIMVLREVSPERGQGATRTIVSVTMGENELNAVDLAKRYIARDTEVMTDEHEAYSSFAAMFDHKTVNHSKEFSTDEGVNNNQAESYFIRARRLVVGQIHRISPKYMMDYANEVAWREDVRRMSTAAQLRNLVHKVFDSGPSKWWLRYWQGNKREGEILMA